MTVFDFLSWGHLLVIALAALFIFGPERLPTLARDAARGLKRVRAAIDATREQLNDSLGDDFDDLRALDLRRYHPRTFLREQLLADPPRSAAQRTSGSPSAVSVRKERGSPGSARDVLPPPVDWEAT